MKSLMLKSLVSIALSSSLFAASNSEITTFLKKGLSNNPNIVSIDVNIKNRDKLDTPKGWESVIVEFKGKVKQGKKTRDIKQNSIYFVNGDFITPELINVKTGKKLNDSVGPKFDKKYYKKENLIYGNVNAKHKVAIFSDPLCPFCNSFVPSALEYMKKYPDTFAVYYYHFPLPGLHPASVSITKAAIVAKKLGIKDAELKMYKIYKNINAREKSDEKILEAFNKVVGTKITPKMIHTKEIEEEAKADLLIASDMMVNGTPTIFLDGKKDASKKEYRKVKVK